MTGRPRCSAHVAARATAVASHALRRVLRRARATLPHSAPFRTLTLTSAEVIARVEAFDVPVGPIYNVADCMADPHYIARVRAAPEQRQHPAARHADLCSRAACAQSPVRALPACLLACLCVAQHGPASCLLARVTARRVRNARARVRAPAKCFGHGRQRLESLTHAANVAPWVGLRCQHFLGPGHV